MSYNEKIRDFFLRIVSNTKLGLSQDFIDEVNDYSNEKLKIVYSELKAVSERKDTMVNSFIVVIFLSFLAGLYQVFEKFSEKVTAAYGYKEESLVLMNGFMFFLVILFIITVIIITFYFYRVYDKKKKFNYIELTMKQRGILD